MTRSSLRLELLLLALFLACWTVVMLHLLGVVPMAGTLDLGMQGLYSLAVAAGWLCGNVYVRRSRGLPRELIRKLRLIYLVGPPGVLALLRAMAPQAAQVAAPFVALYAGIVYAILFLVPVSMQGVFLNPKDDSD
jgi:hypothetical protein